MQIIGFVNFVLGRLINKGNNMYNYLSDSLYELPANGDWLIKVSVFWFVKIFTVNPIAALSQITKISLQ